MSNGGRGDAPSAGLASLRSTWTPGQRRPFPMNSKEPTLTAELLAEFAGTLVLILFGVGVVAQVVTSDGTLGGHDSIAWAWGLGVTFGVYTAARISGAHLNPAVTVALAAFGGFRWP